MTNYSKELNDTVHKATEFIKKIVAEKGKIVLLEEDQDDFADQLYEVPFVTYVGKHGDYREYAILALEHTHQGVKVLGYEKGEGGDTDRFMLEEVYASEMVWLADYLQELIFGRN